MHSLLHILVCKFVLSMHTYKSGLCWSGGKSGSWMYRQPWCVCPLSQGGWRENGGARHLEDMSLTHLCSSPQSVPLKQLSHKDICGPSLLTEVHKEPIPGSLHLSHRPCRTDLWPQTKLVPSLTFPNCPDSWTLYFFRISVTPFLRISI